MSAREWTSLIFKLSGIAILVSALLTAPGELIRLLAEIENPFASTIHWTLMVVAYLVPFLIGAGLILRTDWCIDKAFASVLQRLDRTAAVTDSDWVIDTSTDARASADVEETEGVEGSGEWVLDFPTLHRDDIQAIALTLMGVWVLVSALPDALYYIFSFGDGTGEPVDLSLLVHVATRVGIGLWLFFGAYGIVRTWSQAQQKRSISGVVAGEQR